MVEPVSDRPKQLAVPPLEAPHVFLKAVTPDDYLLLQLVETSSEVAPRWRFRGATPSPEQWSQALWQGVLAQFVVVAKSDARPVGFVSAFQASFQDGHARVAALKFDQSRRSPLMMMGLAVFLDYVFACWDLRKLYVELPEYNFAPIASGTGRVFEVEARLRDHSFLAGELWDELVLAIYRDAWRAHGSALLRGGPARAGHTDGWDAFAAELAALAHAPLEVVEPGTRLVEDLALDSIALAELTASLVDTYGATRLAESLGEIAWEGLTAGALFEGYVSGARA
jgi:RimJ/RimL family protein N-acetyltransferase/acyl carrier protein